MNAIHALSQLSYVPFFSMLRLKLVNLQQKPKRKYNNLLSITQLRTNNLQTRKRTLFTFKNYARIMMIFGFAEFY